MLWCWMVCMLSVTWQSRSVLHLHCKTCSPSISHRCDTVGLHSTGTAVSDRSVCTIQAALSQASLGTSELQTAGQVQTSLQELLGSQHLEECTGADTRQQTIPANTWSIWHFAGPRPMASSCGIVTGPHATKERSPFRCPPPTHYPHPRLLSCSILAQ